MRLDHRSAGGDAGLGTGGGPRLRIGHAGQALPTVGRIDIDVEDAIVGDPLKFGAIAFADLNARVAEMLDQIIGRHADQIIVLVVQGRQRRGRLWGRRGGGPGGAGSEQQGGSKEKTTHASLVAGRVAAGKLAAAARGR